MNFNGTTEVSGSSSMADMVFAQIDRQKGTAVFVGNSGSSTVHVVEGVEAISFMEVTARGNVIVTSIFKGQTFRDFLANSSIYRAVMSRHIGMVAAQTAVVTQFYGTCRAMR